MSALFGESVTQARLELCGDGMVEVLDENGDTVPPRLVRVLSERQGDETDAWMHLSDQHLGRPCALEPNRLHCAVSGVSLAVSDRSDLADVFQTLSPDAQAAALVYGVVDPHVRTTWQIAQILRHADIQSRGRRLTSTRLQSAARELVKHGLAYAPRRRDDGLRASPHWAPWLTMEAHRTGMLDRIVAGHDHVHPRLSYYDDAARTAMALRCHTVAGRLAHVHGGAVEPEAWGFLAEPGAAGLLHTLPEPCRDRALAGCLMRVIDAAALPEPIIDACRELASEPSAFAADIAFIRILQGRLDDIDAVFDALPAEVRESKRVRVGRAGARALAAMLRGDDVQARRHIESAVAEERAGTRKRNVFPASTAFALSLLSLVRDDSPSSRALLAPLLRASAHQKVQPLVMHYVTHAAEARKGAHIDAMTFPYPVFGTMLQGLECCWLGQLGQYTDQTPYQALVGYMDRARANGFAWALAECLAVVGQPDLRMEEGRLRSAAVYREEATAMHARLGTRSLTSLLAPMAQWEYPLKALEELALEARNKPAAANKRRPTTRRRRLVWEILEDAGEVVARPREQHESKNGTWSAGKPVSLKRLATSAATMDFLLEQDRAAAARIRQARDWGGRLRYRVDKAALFELAGHPHVFNEAGAVMEVVRGEPELVIDEHEGGLRARLVPDDGDSGDHHVRLVDRRLQRRDQFRGVEPLSMVAINPDQPLERLARLIGVACDQPIEQCVDRRGLCTVDEEVELVMLPGVPKPGAQQRIQPGIGRGDQNGSGVVLPAMMHRRLSGQTEHMSPRPRLLEPCADLALPIRKSRIQVLKSTFAPCTVVVVAETVRRQQQLQRRVLAMLHHELLNGGLYLPEFGLGVSERDHELRLGWRLVERVATGLAFELGVEGTRREWTNTDDGPEHGIGIGAGWRFAGTQASHGALEMRVEAARRDVASDDRAPEHTIGLNVRARW